MTTFFELQQKYLRGDIPRDEYWREASALHEQLNSYRKTLSHSEIQAIIISEDGLSLLLNNGIRILWNPNDIRSSANTLVNHGNHESDDGKFLLAAAKNSQYIFDIGANAGYYTLHFAKQYPKIKQVHAFEPVPKTFQALLKNITTNKLQPKIVANNLALGQKMGEVNFFVPNFSGSCAASIKNLHPEESNTEVCTTMTTLDEYCNQRRITKIDLIKIDVEGAEFFVLEGAIKTLEKFKPTLFIEILRKWSRKFGVDPNQTISKLLNLGYQCWTVDSGKLTKFHTMTEETVQTNFFFTHPSRVANPAQAWHP